MHFGHFPFFFAMGKKWFLDADFTFFFILRNPKAIFQMSNDYLRLLNLMFGFQKLDFH